MAGSNLSSDRLSVDDLIAQLSQALGEEKAREVIADAVASTGAGAVMSKQQALDVLASVADTPGIVGVCARFARTRLLLAGVPAAPKM